MTSAPRVTPDQWDRVKTIYAAVIDCAPDQRNALLEQLCGADTEVRNEVASLIKLGEGSVLALDAIPAQRMLRNQPPPLAPGELLSDRFRILRMVGAGGMGEVYEAEDTQLGERIALKTIRTELANDQRLVSRFQREVKLARQVTHPNVCRLFDWMVLRRQDGSEVRVLTMEFLDGETLSARIKRHGRFEFRDVRPLLLQICEGMSAVHAAGVVHRDFKPSNVMLVRGKDGAERAVVMDFGVARLLDHNTADTNSTGSWGIGTPAYMAPEQVEGKPVTALADVYALGVVMYELATGNQPYPGNSPIEVAVRKTREPVRPPRDLVAEVDEVWQTILLRCLEYKPLHRFSSVEDLRAALLEQRDQRPVMPRKLGSPQNWRRAILSAACAVVLAAFSWWTWDRWAAAPPLPANAARLYSQGVAASMNGAWFQARQKYTMALESAPDYAAARARLADTLIELDLFDEARAEILRATDAPKRSRDEEALVRAIRGLVLRDLPTACEIFASLAANASKDDALQTSLDLARCWEKADATEKAISTYNRVLASDATNPSALAGRARIWFRSGKTQLAREDFAAARKILERGSELEASEELKLAEATLLESTGKPREAFDLASEARDHAAIMKLVPLRLRADLLLGILQVRLGNSADGRATAMKAIEDARRLRLENLTTQGFIDLGAAFLAQRNFEDARAMMTQGLEFSQKYGAKRLEAVAKYQLARYHATSGVEAQAAPGLLDQAESYFTSARMRREQLRVVTARADYLFGELRFQDAERQFLLAIDLATQLEDPRRIITSNGNIAKLAALQGDYRKSAERNRTAVAIAKSVGERSLEVFYTSRLGNAETNLGNREEGMRLFRSVLDDKRLNDPAAKLVALRGVAFVQTENLHFDEGLRTLDEAMRFAVENKQNSDLLELSVARCVVAGEGAMPRAARECPALVAELERDKFWAMLAEVHMAMAAWHLNQREWKQAESRARLGLEFSKKAEHERNIWWAKLLLAPALLGQGNTSAYRETVLAARAEIELLGKKWGADALCLYLARPCIARRWEPVSRAVTTNN
jgi:tetratricopeptide (TPR) repeat protein/tRNA A-37 threonylcarbamoyl transferase component Bud32